MVHSFKSREKLMFTGKFLLAHLQNSFHVEQEKHEELFTSALKVVVCLKNFIKFLICSKVSHCTGDSILFVACWWCPSLGSHWGKGSQMQRREWLILFYFIEKFWIVVFLFSKKFHKPVFETGLSDPFCTVCISKEEKKSTRVQPATLFPAWNEHFSLYWIINLVKKCIYLIKNIFCKYYRPIKTEDDVLNVEVW